MSGRDKTMPVRRIGMAVAGLGRIGCAHAENLAIRIPSARLVRVGDIRADSARAVGEQFDVPWSRRVDDLIEDPAAEALLIATPTATHAAVIEAAAAAGKHVFCEKPLATDLDSASHAVEIAQRSGVKLQVGLHMRFDPSLATLSERVGAGELGDVYSFRATLRDMRSPGRSYLEGSGGLLLDGGFHTFDLARYMVGEIEEVVSFGAALSDPAFEQLVDVDNAAVLLRFRSGALGVIEHSRVAGYGFDCRVELVGSRKSARVTADRRNGIEWLTPGSMTRDHVGAFLERFGSAYCLEVEAFARSISVGSQVRATGEDALAATLLCEAAQRSLIEGKSVHVKRRDGEVLNGALALEPEKAPVRRR